MLWLVHWLFLFREYSNMRIEKRDFKLKEPPTPIDSLNKDRCMKKWGSILGDCIVNCTEVTDCEADCITDYKDNIEYCPCEVKS